MQVWVYNSGTTHPELHIHYTANHPLCQYLFENFFIKKEEKWQPNTEGCHWQSKPYSEQTALSHPSDYYSGIYTIGKYRYIAIGGAYSVDKQWREPNVSWWADEQPSSEIKAYVEQQLATQDVDAILSHTCPFKYIPTEMFLSGIKQSGVDQSTELWLDTIEERINYKAWFCGHWHTDKRIDKMHFLYHGIESEEYIRE